MSDEKKNDLTTEELLKKLMESFGEPEDLPEATQLNVEDAANDREAKKKVYRYRVGGKTNEIANDGAAAADDDISKELEESIRNAERFVEKMNGGEAPAEEPEEESFDLPAVDGEKDDDLPGELSWLKLLKDEQEEPAAPEEKEEKEAPAAPAGPEPEETEPEGAEGSEETEPEEPEEAAPEEEEDEIAPAPAAFFAPAVETDQPEKPDGSEETEEPEEADEPAASEEPVEDGEPEAPIDGDDLNEEQLNAILYPEKEEEEDEDEPDPALFAVLNAKPDENGDGLFEDGPLPWEDEEPAEDELPSFEEPEEAPGTPEESEEPEEPEEPDDKEEFEPAAIDLSEYEEAPAEEEREPEPEEEPDPEKKPETEEEAPQDDGDLDVFPVFHTGERSVSEEKEETEEPAPEEKEEKQEKKDQEPDENEVNLMMIFDMEKDLENRLSPEELKKVKREIDSDSRAETVEEEYETPDQNGRFFKRFKKSYIGVSIRTWLALIAFAVTAVLEIMYTYVVKSGGSPAAFFKIPLLETPVFTVLIAMQITMLLLAIGAKEAVTGVKAVFTARPAPEILLAATGAMTLVYEIGLLRCAGPTALFYNLPLSLSVLLSVYASKLNLERKLLAFKIVSTRKPKYAVIHKNEKESTKEQEAFGEFISGAAGIYGVVKTPFIKSFGRRSAKAPRYKTVIGVFASVAAAAGIIFFVLGYNFAKGGESKWLNAFEAAIQAVLFTMPLSAFLTYSLPFGRASKKAFRMNSAIIGEYSLEEYSDATVISFDDKEVFPAKNVRVRSLKLYGDSRIDHVLFGAASVFHKLGGPLDEVFSAATRESGYTEDVDILEIEQDGVEAAVKGARVYVGGSVFMRGRGLLPSVDPDDEAVEAEGRMSVMYLAIGEELSAKMYVEYKPDAEIKDIMASLYKSGMCIGIRTLDPNIDDEMLRCHVDLGNYPAKVLRMDRAEDEKESDPIDSGVVSKGKVKDLLRSLSFCRKVLQVIRAGTLFKVFAVVLGAGLAAALLFLGQTGAVNSMWLTIWQLAMMIPVFVVSILFT